ncbi:hypothetical protein SAMN06272789_1251 [Streptomyces sp. 1331.2]|nr:hypothetical protein SAMN06272789_1251 [Streptomyces sp. 1331.2]
MTASTKSRAAASSSIRRVVRARSTARPASSSGQVGPGRRCPGGRPPPGSRWSPSGPACPAAPSSTPPRSHRTTRGRTPPPPKPGAVRLLDAAILTPTPTIGRPEGTVLVSGDPEAFAPHAGTLRALGTVRDAGADPLLRSPGGGGRPRGRRSPRSPGGQQAWQPLGVLAEFGAADALGGGACQGVDPSRARWSKTGRAGRCRRPPGRPARGLDTSVLDAALALTRRTVTAGLGPDGVSFLLELLSAREVSDDRP